MGLSIKDVFRQLWRDIRAEKLRTFLTVFGIVWGTVAITLMLAFGTGQKKQLVKSTAGLGDRIVIGWPSLTSIPYEGLGKGRRIRLTEDDLEAARKQTPGVKGLSGEYETSFKVQYGTKTMSVDCSGVTPEFGSMRNLIPESGGRFIDDIDNGEQRRVVFIGDKFKKNIFGDAAAVGKTMMINQSPFLVVGVLKEKDQDSSYSGRDNDKMFIPASTYRALSGSKYINNFILQPENAGMSKEVTAAFRTALGKRLRFDPKDKEALSVWDTTEQFQFFDIFMLAFNGFLGLIGVLTLVVGGIGVSNIMNVVVEERTREIGIKMALGAKQRWVLTQFLIETMLVTSIGGIVGFAISIGICSIFPDQLVQYVGKPVVSAPVALLTTAALGMVGFVAGYFPAREAARLDPVVAMKL